MKSINNNTYYELNNSSSIIEIFNLISNQNTNEKKRLTALNNCTKLLSNSTSNIFTTEELLYCLSSNYVSNITQIRAGALRLSRYILNTVHDLQTFNKLQLPILLCRSLDLVVKNEEERIQALKLIRKMIAIQPDLLNPAIVRCLTSLGDTLMIDGTKPDRIVRACLATLSELGVLNPVLLILTNGVAVITRNVLECDSPRIAESLVGVLLHLLEYPHTRNIAGIRLDCLAAPYCDFTYRLGIMDKNKDARELRFKCSRLALLSVLRSFNGVLEFCNPNKASGLKAIIDVLYLNQLEVRKAILDLLYELINLPQAVWTDEYSVALAAVDPSDYQDSWRLSEGFVALEGRSVLPSLINKVPNICEIHQAFILYCFLENGLLNALVEVIISSDTFISVRATILLAKLLQMIHTMLPADVCSTSPPLPMLIAKATEGNYQARAAISALQAYHTMIKNRPAACSLYLDCIIQNGELIKSRLFKREIDAVESLSKSASLTFFERMRHDSIGSTDASASFYFDIFRDTTSMSGETETSKSFEKSKGATLVRRKIIGFLEKFRENERLIKDSLVLTHVDANTWDWDIVVTIFRNKTLSAKPDEDQLKFIKNLTNYFKPSSNKFSHMELSVNSNCRMIPSNVHAGIMLIDYLLEQIDELEYMRVLTDYCSDISTQLQAIYKKKAHDCLFSPSHMNTTMCQQYFLFIGRLCRSKKGIDILKNTDILKHLTYLVANTNHTIYVKLIVSGLDYSSAQPHPRLILEKALTSSPNQASRLYATQFLLVLLRARLPTFEEWGIQIIMNQLKDKDRAVVLAALEIIEEACHENIYLLELAHVWPELDKYHEVGKYTMMRFYSIPRGLNHPNANVKAEIDLWISVYNKKYVLFVESETHSTMTLHTKSEDGYYMSRNSFQQRQMVKTTNLPCHLYGALVQTQRGISYLQKHGNISYLIDVLSSAKCGNEDECLLLKSALWAIGHVATNHDGIEFLNNTVTRVFEKVIQLIKYCEIYSIRACAFNVLCLMSTTVNGSNLLYKLDWMSVRHDRNNEFPILEPEDWHLKNPSPARYNHDMPAYMPAYNYGGIDDSIMLNLSGTQQQPSLVIEESIDSIKEDDNRDESLNMTTSTQKSKTLPVGTLPSQMHQKNVKHIRSLSESKTTDGITGLASTTTTTNRTRFNSGDSNTSGVSSCDSINIKADKRNERFRRVSLTGTPIKDVSQLSNQDIHGYKKLRMIRRNMRPMLSESAADDILADIFENDGNGGKTSNRLLQSFNLDSKRKQSKNLERQTINISGFDDIQKNIYVAKLLTQIDTKGPCYRGICLPRNILDLFPDSHSQSGTTYVSRYIQEIETLESNNLSTSSILLKNQYPNEGDAAGDLIAGQVPDESAVSSMSDLSTTGNRRMRKRPIILSGVTSAMTATATDTATIESDMPVTMIRSMSSTGGTIKHNKDECLLCCRSKVISRVIDTSLNIQEPKENLTSMNGKIRDSDVSFYSPESIVSDDSANTNMPDRISNIILRNFQKMANPIMFKTCRKILMELKQKYPQSFQDICLYSEVCKFMGSCNYRMTVRRFIQEIFLDLNYDAFNTDVDLILNAARQRLTDLKLLDTSKTFPSSPPQSSSNVQVLNVHIPSHSSSSLPASSPTSSTHSQHSATGITISITSTTTSITTHKLHSLKSPLLASVHESSVENLIVDSPKESIQTKDEVDSSVVILRTTEKKTLSSPGSSQKVKAEIHDYRHSIDASSESSSSMQPIRRRRFNTLELDLSCTRNKFPIKHRSQPSATSTLQRRPISSSSANSNNNKEDVEQQSTITKKFSTSDHSFESTQSISLTSPISPPPLGPLYCEQRLLQSDFHKSEATLSNNNRNINLNIDKTNDKQKK
ncbi:hypothetical protein PVAND_008879 [Polypedilum vanderplanki]|uniref:Rapamycin-insensitive companion of mTOR n=1 Tax=Polypedilum vanderplanki TaxID=319348 RepID=A0A9J6CBL2_POLVA|nr:hypothetical protein PVAND_008879 [Polypedilum vanderplanki]